MHGMLAAIATCAAPRFRTKSGQWYSPLYPELFRSDDGPRREWFEPELIDALEAADDSALRRLTRREHPDAEVFSFPWLRPSFAQMLLSEADHYAASGLSNPKPNGMNNYGLLFNHIGMEQMWQEIVRRMVAPLAQVLFPHLLGGGSLDNQHAYTVHYDTTSDSHGLDIHHDSSDITFNAALDAAGSFEGSGLRFCGLYSTRRYRQYSFTYRHTLGRAILYDGRMRHGAEPILSGSRTNLVVWMHASAYRASAAAKANNEPRHEMGAGSADPRCVSHHHDADYCAHRLPGFEAYCPFGADGVNTFMRTWRNALSHERYWQVGTTLDDVSSSTSGSSDDSAQCTP